MLQSVRGGVMLCMMAVQEKRDDDRRGLPFYHHACMHKLITVRREASCESLS